MKSRYLDLHNKPIDLKQRLDLLGDPDYRVRGFFENENVVVTAYWHGDTTQNGNGWAFALETFLKREKRMIPIANMTFNQPTDADVKVAFKSIIERLEKSYANCDIEGTWSVRDMKDEKGRVPLVRLGVASSASETKPASRESLLRPAVKLGGGSMPVSSSKTAASPAPAAPAGPTSAPDEEMSADDILAALQAPPEPAYQTDFAKYDLGNSW